MTLSRGIAWFITQYLPRLLQTDLASLDLLVEHLIKPDKVSVLRMVEIDCVGGCQRIIPLAHQVGLGAFERAGEFKLGANADEERTRISGQPVDQMPAKGN